LPTTSQHMRIVFVHEENAFLPELQAYHHYFSSRGVECMSTNRSQANETAADVLWHFMGTSVRRTSCVTIHEYSSSSTAPLARLKNVMKKTFNSKPDFRLFLNKFVRHEFAFNDNIPFGLRDMGVASTQITQQHENAEKKFDFIYIGELVNRNMERMLELFSRGELSQHSLLILSKDYEHLQSRFQPYNNIEFKGPVPQNEVSNFLMQARFGLNVVPNRFPFNHQTSTKLLEYAAAKLPIVTSDYDWVRQFQKEFGGEYYFITEELTNLNWKTINAFSYSWPDLSQWSWDHQIRKSGVLEFLESKFPLLNLTSSAVFGHIPR
jgi:glycosyltransferase involved in cell wall biosynthesis